MTRFHRRSFLVIILTFAAFLGANNKILAQNNFTGRTPNYAGYADRIGCDIIGGWAADRNALNTSIPVSIYSDGALVATALANRSRPDVGSYLGDNGLHGFAVATPAGISDGNAHQVRVVFDSSTVDLSNSPAAVICTSGPPPLCAYHQIKTTPNQGPSYSVVNYFCRDRELRTSYDTGRYVTVNDPVAHETRLFDKLTAMYGVFSSTSPGAVSDYDTAISGDSTATAPPPPPHTPTSCPTGNDGWSVQTPSTIHNTALSASASASSQIVNVWTCSQYVLPMYLEIVDPNFGKTDLEFDPITLGDPAPQTFAVPAGYTRDDSFSWLAGFGSSCAVQQPVDPVIMVSSGPQVAQTLITAMTAGSGCSFTDARIFTGRSVSAMPVTSRYSPIFQLALWDNGDPQYPNAVDTAQVSLTTSDGSVSNHLVILLKIK
jgi:hypothetical protein